MAETPGMVAVAATDAKYHGLKHMPGGLPLDAAGRGLWPADQFTFRLIQEGALKRADNTLSPAAEKTAPSSLAADRLTAQPVKPAPAKSKGS